MKVMLSFFPSNMEFSDSLERKIIVTNISIQNDLGQLLL
jgi:hypothetical protein